MYVFVNFGILFCLCVYVFFFKQKTAYEMRISDWSSDVCSSDLSGVPGDLQLYHADRDHGPPVDRGRADVGHSARDPDLHPAVPRHRRNPRVSPEFGAGAQTRADAEMECRGGDAADPGRKVQLFRRRAADEL